MLELLAFGWLGWSGFNLLLIVVAGNYGASDPLLAMHVRGVFHPTIHARPGLERQVTSVEYSALMLHELGHIALGHLWRNAMMAVVFPWWPRSQRVAEQQELDADRYVLRFGNGKALASALRSLSLHPFDLRRAEILEVACGTQAGLASGTDALKGDAR